MLHTSDAVGAVKLGVEGQVTVPSAPGDPITGGVLSITVMVCATVPLYCHKHLLPAMPRQDWGRGTGIWHEPGAAVPAAILPQAVAKT